MLTARDCYFRFSERPLLVVGSTDRRNTLGELPPPWLVPQLAKRLGVVSKRADEGVEDFGALGS